MHERNFMSPPKPVKHVGCQNIFTPLVRSVVPLRQRANQELGAARKPCRLFEEMLSWLPSVVERFTGVSVVF
jgi:hypothetical protein